MGIEQDKQAAKAETGASPDYEERVRRAIIDAQERRDTPLNGGYGIEDINDLGDRAAARDRAVAQFLDHNTLPPGCAISFVPTMPYSGSELPDTVVVKHPPVGGNWMERPA